MRCSRSPYKRGRHIWNAHGQCQWCKACKVTPDQLQEGANRERLRIRRAQRAEYHWIEQALGNYHAVDCFCMRCEAHRALVRIDAATRGKGRK